MKVTKQNITVITDKKNTIKKYYRDGDNIIKPPREVYTSTIHRNEIRAWKRHKLVFVNLSVILGEIRVISTLDLKKFQIANVSAYSDSLITIPPGIWYGFKGISEEAMIINLASEVHSEEELERISAQLGNFDWEQLT